MEGGLSERGYNHSRPWAVSAEGWLVCSKLMCGMVVVGMTRVRLVF